MTDFDFDPDRINPSIASASTMLNVEEEYGFLTINVVVHFPANAVLGMNSLE